MNEHLLISVVWTFGSMPFIYMYIRQEIRRRDMNNCVKMKAWTSMSHEELVESTDKITDELADL